MSKLSPAVFRLNGYWHSLYWNLVITNTVQLHLKMGVTVREHTTNVAPFDSGTLSVVLIATGHGGRSWNSFRCAMGVVKLLSFITFHRQISAFFTLS